MSIKKSVIRTAMLAIVAICLCLGSRPALASTSGAHSFKLSCAHAQAAVAYLENLEESVTDWYEQGYITSTEEQQFISYIDDAIQEIEAAATQPCSF